MLHDLIYALREGFRRAQEAYRFARHMRRGGNPDWLPF